jgi:hypothetical protein
MSAAAAIKGRVTGSPSKGTAIAAPIKGAVEKYAPGAGRTEMAQSQYEECEAHAITEEPDDSGRGKGPLSGQLRAVGKAQRSIDETGGNTLDHCDLDRIGGAELAGQVVIDAPTDAGRYDQRTASADSYYPMGCWPRQYERAGEYGHGAGKHAAIDVLSEHDPGDRHGGETFGVEKKRTGPTRCGRQSCHQQRRTENTAEENDQAKPREIAPAQRRLCGSAGKADAQADDAEADSGTEIEQAGEQQRVGYA